MGKESHLERTASEPRDFAFHNVIISDISQATSEVRIIRLQIPGNETIKFLPGQWLDVYIPSAPEPGGFSITSPPSRAAATPPYLELAVQHSPENPPAAFLWHDLDPTSSSSSLPVLVGITLQVRVGGSFVWPPRFLSTAAITTAPGPMRTPSLLLSPPATLATDETKPARRVVLIAGGVGVNPLMSILSHLADENTGRDDASEVQYDVRMLYSVRDPGPAGEPREANQILFLERIVIIFARESLRGDVKLFLTWTTKPTTTRMAGAETETEEDNARAAATDEQSGVVYCNEVELPFSRRRISGDDLREAVGHHQDSAVAYVCGPPPMTEHLVKLLTSPDVGGMDPQRVLYEKWW